MKMFMILIVLLQMFMSMMTMALTKTMTMRLGGRRGAHPPFLSIESSLHGAAP